MTSLVNARNVSKHFGPVRAVDNVSFEIEKGRILGLIGPNGAGKTTLLKALLGLTDCEGELSVLGLVRHMTQMEHVFLAWGLGGGERVMRYGEDDYAGGSAATVDDDLRWYFEEVEKAEAAIAAMSTLDASGQGHGRPLRATLVKMIDEYALHAGQAHMLRFAALGEVRR